MPLMIEGETLRHLKELAETGKARFEEVVERGRVRAGEKMDALSEEVEALSAMTEANYLMIRGPARGPLGRVAKGGAAILIAPLTLVTFGMTRLFDGSPPQRIKEDSKRRIESQRRWYEEEVG